MKIKKIESLTNKEQKEIQISNQILDLTYKSSDERWKYL